MKLKVGVTIVTAGFVDVTFLNCVSNPSREVDKKRADVAE